MLCDVVCADTLAILVLGFCLLRTNGRLSRLRDAVLGLASLRGGHENGDQHSSLRNNREDDR
jgi:hypothetical protein